MRIIPDKMFPRVIDIISGVLDNSALLTVTRDEYMIMHTPEGELYDKSILQAYVVFLS